jgi:hypothetical protein
MSCYLPPWVFSWKVKLQPGSQKLCCLMCFPMYNVGKCSVGPTARVNCSCLRTNMNIGVFCNSVILHNVSRERSWLLIFYLHIWRNMTSFVTVGKSQHSKNHVCACQTDCIGCIYATSRDRLYDWTLGMLCFMTLLFSERLRLITCTIAYFEFLGRIGNSLLWVA